MAKGKPRRKQVRVIVPVRRTAPKTFIMGMEEDLHFALKKRAFEERTTMSEVLTKALLEYLKRHNG
jgi:hypothetical protein